MAKKCQCYKSLKQTDAQCTYNAKEDSNFCGVHRNCHPEKIGFKKEVNKIRVIKKVKPAPVPVPVPVPATTKKKVVKKRLVHSEEKATEKDGKVIAKIVPVPIVSEKKAVKKRPVHSEEKATKKEDKMIKKAKTVSVSVPVLSKKIAEKEKKAHPTKNKEVQMVVLVPSEGEVSPSIAEMYQDDVRVRQILNVGEHRLKLITKLPPNAKNLPDLPKSTYPKSILGLFCDDKYSNMGYVTELLLRFPVIDYEALKTAVSYFTTKIPPNSPDVVDFIKKVRNTRAKILAMNCGTLQYDTAVQSKGVVGHPDIMTSTDIFEVKTSGYVNRKNWQYFI
ncbi:MAG: hypothetical protein WCO05_05165, partial [Candidatus Moraniibacteriota bacterium]